MEASKNLRRFARTTKQASCVVHLPWGLICCFMQIQHSQASVRSTASCLLPHNKEDSTIKRTHDNEDSASPAVDAC